VFGAVAGDPARHDFSPFADEASDHVNLLVINAADLVSAETAALAVRTRCGWGPWPAALEWGLDGLLVPVSFMRAASLKGYRLRRGVAAATGSCSAPAGRSPRLSPRASPPEPACASGLRTAPVCHNFEGGTFLAVIGFPLTALEAAFHEIELPWPDTRRNFRPACPDHDVHVRDFFFELTAWFL
jgi:hypothetical protein